VGRLGRRRFDQLGTSALAGLGLCGCDLSAGRPGTSAQRAPLPEQPVCFPEGRPNVLFVSIDDLNDFASPWGSYPGAVAPNLDRLAARGVTFEQAYCSVPMCGGSRSATMSGIAPFRSGLHRQQNILDVEDQVLSRIPADRLESIPRWFSNQGTTGSWAAARSFTRASGWSATGWPTSPRRCSMESATAVTAALRTSCPKTARPRSH
jgi:hypothetical protein